MSMFDRKSISLLSPTFFSEDIFYFKTVFRMLKRNLNLFHHSDQSCLKNNFAFHFYLPPAGIK